MHKKVYITKQASFEAAHNLPLYSGKCHNVHGHSYKVEVTCSAYVSLDTESSDLDPTLFDFMVMDFHTLNDVIKRTIVDKYDHKNLNDFFYMPTAEVMAVAFYNALDLALIPYSGVNLEEVKLWETDTSYASYRGEVNA